jgi:3-hydroxyacyl-CoA dehydrogenase
VEHRSEAPSDAGFPSNLVLKTISREIAVLTLAKPPANALGGALRAAIAERLREVAADPEVKAAILIGSERIFSAGGDISEFDGPIAEPDLPTLVAQVDLSPKLVVAAIGGACMGGGLELAMAAHYRIALAKSTLALPETKIGLVPGAGGTQRLPRALGLERALRLILDGATFMPRDASDGCLIDRIVDGDLRSEALAFTRSLLDEKAPLRRLGALPVESNSPPVEIFARARQEISRKAERYPALPAAIDCLEVAVAASVEEGQRFERGRFLELRNTPTARGLRHAFLAERTAGKIPGLDDSVAGRKLRSVAVVGAGTMGRGICISFLRAGLPVTLIDSEPAALEGAAEAIRSTLEQDMRKGRLTGTEFYDRLSLLTRSPSLSACGGADLVVEAVFEDLSVKQDLFRKLDSVAKPGAVLATNTSTLDVDTIAAATGRPEDVVGLHFFSPAHVMRLLEVVRGRMTSDDVLATAIKIARLIGKVGVVSGVCDGFIGNRMLEHYVRMAHLMVEEGALPWEVDQALESWGMAMGPFRMGDLAGNDIGWAVRKRRYRERPQVRYARIADALCEAGRFGQKTGAGWYLYRDGGRHPEPDPETVRIIEDYRAGKGIVPRAIGGGEIVARCIFALVNEGARIVEGGIAMRVSDIDVVYLNGYGFPRFRGGPMKYADETGLPQVVAAMERFHAASGDPFWEPARLLQEAAAEGKSLTGGA